MAERWPNDVVDAVVCADGCAFAQNPENPCDGLYGCERCVQAMLDAAAPAIFAAELRRRVAAMDAGALREEMRAWPPVDEVRTLLLRALGVEAPDAD